MHTRQASWCADHRARGFITIATVLVLLAVGVAAALTAFLVAWQITDAQTIWLRSAQARGLADACAEHARAQFWGSPAYAGSESLDFQTGRCAVLPMTSASSGSYDVRTEGIVAGIIARDTVTYDLTVDASGSVQTVAPSLYREVAEF